MPDKPIEFKVQGEVSLDTLRESFGYFVDLMQELTREADPDVILDWVVADLHGGSAAIAVRPDATTPAQIRAAQIVQERYRHVGELASQGDIRELPAPTREIVGKITRLTDGTVKGIVFKSDDSEYEVTRPAIAESEPVQVEQPSLRRYIIGGLRGRVVTLDQKQALYFTLKEERTGANIRCYPTTKQRKMMSSLWDQWVNVFGRITRDKATGLPETVTQIRSVELIEPMEPGAWREAFGSLQFQPGDEPPEEILRRADDA